jgi:hypothetical protein
MSVNSQMQFVLLVCSPIHSLYFPDSRHSCRNSSRPRGLFPWSHWVGESNVGRHSYFACWPWCWCYPWSESSCVTLLDPPLHCPYVAGHPVPFTPLIPIISLYLSVWNPPGPSTPQASTHPTPDHYRTSTIKELIKQSTEKRVSALKKLVLIMHMLYFECWNFLEVELRDNALQCPVTRIPFQPAQHGVVSELAHILPFAVHGKVNRNYELPIYETNNSADGDP